MIAIKEPLLAVSLIVGSARIWAANLLPQVDGVREGTEVHLVDNDAGSSNSGQKISLPWGTVCSVRGKVLYFAGFVRQIAANNPSEVGFLLAAFDKDNRLAKSCKIGTASHGVTPWLDLRLAIEVPADATRVEVAMNCANGWYNVGEASFRKLMLTEDPDELPAPTIAKMAEFEESRFLEISPTNDTPAMAEFRKSYREQPPTPEDGKSRPEIRNGTWYLNGRPEFFVGPWIGDRVDYCNPLGIDNIAYRKPGSSEAFDFAGFNSAQISAAHSFYGAILRGLPIDLGRRHWQPDFIAREKINVGYYADFANRPLVLDFAFGYLDSMPRSVRKIADQFKCGSSWHGFIPLCPECPEGRRYYHDYFVGGTRAALRHGANIYMYELFNESAYACACRYNLAKFAELMQARYATIDRANSIWRTHFRSFWEVSIQSDPAQYDGMRYDWYCFLSDRYCEVLKEGIADIRSVDGRGGILFTEQASGNPSVHRGEDVCKLAELLDSLAIEGGWRYGGGREYEAKDGMDAVIAGASTKHFFNCDYYLAAVRSRKPVVNNEHYCGRFENDLRVPSRREDYITSLWLETMHGVSASYFYSWDKRSWDYRDAAGAKSNVVHHSYKSYSFLNPFNCPPENLNAFALFRKELEPYRDRLLPFPRVKPATVAVYSSRTREIHRSAFPRHDPKIPEWQEGKHTRTSDWYLAVLHSLYPVKVIFERDLEDVDRHVRAIVVPEAEAEKVSVAKALDRLAERGVKVIVEKGSFAFDEHMAKMGSRNLSKFVPVADAREMLGELARSEIPKYANLEPLDGKGTIKGVDVQICDRGEFKLICIAAMMERRDRKARLSLAGLDGRGPWKLKQVPNGMELPSADDSTWTTEELLRGIELTIPPQERMVIVAESGVR